MFEKETPEKAVDEKPDQRFSLSKAERLLGEKSGALKAAGYGGD